MPDMLTRVKLAIAIVALGMFFYGVRNDASWARWVAIALLAAAFLLRFADRFKQSE